MDAKKMVKQAERALQRSISRKSAGDSGGIKLMPTLIHGDEAPVRAKNVPVINSGNRVDPEAYVDYE